MLTNKNGSREDIGTKLYTSDLSASGVLEGGPVLGLDQNLLVEPLRDGLLGQGWPFEIVREALGQSSLATSNLDSPLQRDNVRFIHDHPRYTTMVVSVNNQGRVTAHNDGDRLRVCMAQRARQLGRAPKDYTQSDLIAEATRTVGRNPDHEREWVISQQGLSLILNNKVSESHAAIAFAMALGVEPAWLQYGIGPSSFADRILNTGRR